jgi:hypothetical protein
LSHSQIIDRAGQWFLRSGIQHNDGGVARYYRTDERAPAPVSTEITGYAASTFAYLHQISGDEEYRESSALAANFLVRSWDESAEGMPFELEGASGAPRLAYFFDCGIIVRGLVRAAGLTGEERYREYAAKIARSMADDFREGDTLHPVIELPDKAPLPHEGGWSRQPGCYQLKSAVGWLEAPPSPTHDAGQLYDSALRAALANDAQFLGAETEITREMDRLHAYCYYLEGLLAAANISDHAAVYRQGIPRIVEWRQRIGPRFVRSDVYAQLLRIRLFADALGLHELDRDEAAAEAATIEFFQHSDDDPDIDGSFGFGAIEGREMPFANPVSTAFCLQALVMWEQYRAGTFQPALSELI